MHWRVFLEHKLYEPAVYSTVINDWGTSYYCARELGPKALCLVHLGHHAPNVNIDNTDFGVISNLLNGANNVGGNGGMRSFVINTRINF